eukprot:Platyproteum_vivax@DN6281_c0_g1_i1.p1
MKILLLAKDLRLRSFFGILKTGYAGWLYEGCLGGQKGEHDTNFLTTLVRFFNYVESQFPQPDDMTGLLSWDELAYVAVGNNSATQFTKQQLFDNVKKIFDKAFQLDHLKFIINALPPVSQDPTNLKGLATRQAFNKYDWCSQPKYRENCYLYYRKPGWDIYEFIFNMFDGDDSHILKRKDWEALFMLIKNTNPQLVPGALERARAYVGKPTTEGKDMEGGFDVFMAMMHGQEGHVSKGTLKMAKNLNFRSKEWKQLGEEALRHLERVWVDVSQANDSIQVLGKNQKDQFDERYLKDSEAKRFRNVYKVPNPSFHLSSN